jgi:hypothetical protein
VNSIGEHVGMEHQCSRYNKPGGGGLVGNVRYFLRTLPTLEPRFQKYKYIMVIS